MKIPIAVKYAGLSGILLIAGLAFAGNQNLKIALGEQDELVNNMGISNVVQLAHAIEPFWVVESSRPRRELESDLHQELSTLRDRLGPETIDILVVEANRKTLVADAKGAEQIRLSARSALTSQRAVRVGVSITQGRLGGEPVRFFESAITYPSPKTPPTSPTGDGAASGASEQRVAGYVRLFVSARSIDRLERELSANMLWTILLAIGIGLPLIAIAGGLLTRPIRVLTKDMATVAAGDFEHQSTIRTGDELERLASAFNSMTSQLAESREREAGRQALERELAIATTIQTALLPDRIPQIDGFQLFPYYSSAKEIGGDYYDFLQFGPDRYGIVVADVSGKGIPGSLVMTMTRSLMRMASREGGDLARVLTRVNTSLSEDMTRGMFVTLIVADFDAERSTVRIARAGHNPAYLYRAATRELLEIQPAGIALGMVRDSFAPNLEVTEHRLDVDDFLVLYTDGIIEAMDHDLNEYTAERFTKVLQAAAQHSAREIVAAVLADLNRHTAGAEPSDDITILVLKRT